MAWLGSGWTRQEMDPEGDRAFYLSEIDRPQVPLSGV